MRINVHSRRLNGGETPCWFLDDGVKKRANVRSELEGQGRKDQDLRAGDGCV